MGFTFPDVGEDNCFDSVKMYERTGLFDFSCKDELKPWGQSTDFAVGILVDHYNKASKGACQTVTEFGDAFSVKTSCAPNGATIKRYDNEDCQGKPKEDFVPWNYCYEGILKIKYRAKEELIPIEEIDEIDDTHNNVDIKDSEPLSGNSEGSDEVADGASVEQNLSEKAPAAEE